MNKRRNLPEVKGVSPISKNVAYQKAAAYFASALDVVVDVMKNSKNDNARLGAARTIIDKVLPNLKAYELKEENDKDIRVVIEDYRNVVESTDELPLRPPGSPGTVTLNPLIENNRQITGNA